MAYRRHIVAARNTDRDAFAQALAAQQVSDIEESGGWCWAMASVWTTGADQLLDVLKGLEGPALLTTTEDGSRWWLHLVRKGLDRFSTFHEFTMIGNRVSEEGGEDDWEDIYGCGDEEDEGDDGQVIELGPPPLPEQRLEPLDFEDPFFEDYADEELEEDDDEEEEEEDFDYSPDGALLGEYEDMGAPLPVFMVEALDGLPDGEVTERFLALHAEYIADAIETFGIPHERDEVIRILTGVGVSGGEFESDVGNLWRFLTHLGLGAKFADALDELEGEEEESEEPYDPAVEILRAVAKLPMHAVGGGPALVPAEEAPLLSRVANCLEDAAEIAMAIHYDMAGATWPPERVPSYAQLTPHEGGSAMTFGGHDTLQFPKARARVGRLLAALPDGAALELAGAGDSVKFRFLGSIRGGMWHVDQASAALEADEIGQLLDLFRNAEARAPQIARDDAEAEAVLEAARKDITLYDSLPERHGLSLVSTTREGAKSLAGLFFRRRYRHRWDVAPIEKRLEDNFRDWKKLGEDMAREAALPVTDRVIHEGTASRFFEPDYDAPSVDDVLRARATDTDKLDGEFGALGYGYLGVLVCERVGGGFLRCYANEKEKAFGVAYFLPFGMTWHEFVSYMDDETVLTTTSFAMESSIRSLRILIRLCAQADVNTLHDNHVEGLNRLRERGMSPTEIDASPEGIAKRMDDFLVRRLGAGDEDGE